MKKLSGAMRLPTPRHVAKFYKTLLLAILALACSLASSVVSARGQSAVNPLQQNEAPQKAKAQYTCPMHLEVKSAKPGTCPKCGMALRLVKDRISSPSNNATSENMIADAHSADIVNGGPASIMKMNIPDVEVLDQDGNKVHFYRDLTKDKTVVINFVFTTCTTICPPLAATFARVQKDLGDVVGKDVHFISISVDPVTDTPQRLKAWGAKFHAGAGWTFVTGDKEQIDKLLNALGASVARREDHSPTVLIGNDLTGEWTRTYGLARPSQLMELILKVKKGRTDESLAKEPHQ